MGILVVEIGECFCTLYHPNCEWKGLHVHGHCQRWFPYQVIYSFLLCDFSYCSIVICVFYQCIFVACKRICVLKHTRLEFFSVGEGTMHVLNGLLTM